MHFIFCHPGENENAEQNLMGTRMNPEAPEAPVASDKDFTG